VKWYSDRYRENIQWALIRCKWEKTPGGEQSCSDDKEGKRPNQRGGFIEQGAMSEKKPRGKKDKKKKSERGGKDKKKLTSRGHV